MIKRLFLTLLIAIACTFCTLNASAKIPELQLPVTVENTNAEHNTEVVTSVRTTLIIVIIVDDGFVIVVIH